MKIKSFKNLYYPTDKRQQSDISLNFNELITSNYIGYIRHFVY